MDTLHRQIFSHLAVLAVAWLAGNATAAPAVSPDQLARGQYLVRAGDCASCHTAQHGKPFAGGRGIVTPFGVIFSTNLTPDKETGIGRWTEKQFYGALHDGVDDEGHHLYPAMPYPWYTKLSRADVDAIHAYLGTVAPVRQEARPVQLPWPLSWRGSMVGWNMLYFDAGTYQTDTSRSAQWNRGAYLVEGLGHCSACHSPKNVLGAVKKHESLEGGSANEHWFAPGLGGNLRDGVGSWSNAEIVEYLKTGANLKSASVGPMTEVVMNSTQYLTMADLDAIATYLKQRPAAPTKSPPEVAALGADALARGQALYIDNCTACHMDDGRGVAGVFPPLAGSSAIQADEAGTDVHVVLSGSRMAAPASKPTGLAMPAFGWKFDNAQMVDVINYIRHAWGNRAPTIDVDLVKAVRKDVKPGDSPSRDAVKVRADAHARPALWDVDEDPHLRPHAPAAPASAEGH